MGPSRTSGSGCAEGIVPFTGRRDIVVNELSVDNTRLTGVALDALALVVDIGGLDRDDGSSGGDLLVVHVDAGKRREVASHLRQIARKGSNEDSGDALVSGAPMHGIGVIAPRRREARRVRQLDSAVTGEACTRPATTKGRESSCSAWHLKLRHRRRSKQPLTGFGKQSRPSHRTCNAGTVSGDSGIGIHLPIQLRDQNKGKPRAYRPYT